MEQKGGTSMKVGYIRVSTVHQEIARQVKQLEEYGVDRLFIEKISGKNMDRPQLREMLNFIREGDTVVVESISRAARNTKDFLAILENIQHKNVGFISLKENYDTSSPQGKFMTTVFAALAELERDCLLERQAEGIAIARAEGRYAGRPKNEYNEKKLSKVAEQWMNGEITASAAAEKLGIGRTTFYRVMKEHNFQKKI